MDTPNAYCSYLQDCDILPDGSNFFMSEYVNHNSHLIIADDCRDIMDAVDDHAREPSSAASCDDADETAKRFACPFYKNDARQFRDWRPCVGPGFQTIHRLKSVITAKFAPPVVNVIPESTSSASMPQRHIVADAVLSPSRRNLSSKLTCDLPMLAS